MFFYQPTDWYRAYYKRLKKHMHDHFIMRPLLRHYQLPQNHLLNPHDDWVHILLSLPIIILQLRLYLDHSAGNYLSIPKLDYYSFETFNKHALFKESFSVLGQYCYTLGVHCLWVLLFQDEGWFCVQSCAQADDGGVLYAVSDYDDCVFVGSGALCDE